MINENNVYYVYFIYCDPQMYVMYPQNTPCDVLRNNARTIEQFNVDSDNRLINSKKKHYF